MKIIGERINDTWTRVKKAISERDAPFVQRLARRQAEAGADWLEVSAGTFPEREVQDLVWLVQTVQEVVDVLLCLDSANPRALVAAIKEVGETPLVNSISGERKRLDDILPLVWDSGCGVIALAMDDEGLPSSVEDRLAAIRGLLDELHRAGVPDDPIYVDPLVMAIAANTESGRIALDTMRGVRAEFPDVHIACGLSNVSFGLPARTLVNQAFLTLALDAGLDTAILDPLDRGVRGTLLAADAVLGRDRFCVNYARGYRAGVLTGPVGESSRR
jgi:cobalamin-dependent methionine synthase I